MKRADQSAHRRATHQSVLRVANFSPSKDARFQMKHVTVRLSCLKSPKNPLPFVRLIIAQEETIDIIGI